MVAERIRHWYNCFNSAGIALLTSVVQWGNAGQVTHIVWNVTLAFISIMIISLMLDEIDFFECAAIHKVKASNGYRLKMFVYPSCY